MDKSRRKLFIVACLMGLWIVSACAPKTVLVEREVEKEVTKVVAGAPVIEKVVKETVVVEKEVARAVEKEQVAKAEPAPSPPAADDTSGAGSDVSSVPRASPRRSDRMIIKDADLDLLVADTEVAIDRVTQVAIDSFGYVLSSRTWYDDDFKYATITIGVPAEEYETALRRLRGIAIRVLNENASGTERVGMTPAGREHTSAACCADIWMFLLLGRMRIFSAETPSHAFRISAVEGFIVCPPLTTRSTPRLARISLIPSPAATVTMP